MIIMYVHIHTHTLIYSYGCVLLTRAPYSSRKINGLPQSFRLNE